MGVDQDRCDIELREGTNTLLLKLSRRDEAGWGFAARIADEFGRPIMEGVTVVPPQGLPDPALEKARKAAAFEVLGARHHTNLLPGYGNPIDTMELGVRSIHHSTMQETGWPIAFYLDTTDKKLFPGHLAHPAWKYPYTASRGGVVFTADDLSGETYDGSNIVPMSDASGRPICKSFFRSGVTNPDGRYSDRPAATVRLPKDKPQRYRLCVVGVTHLSDGGVAPNPNLPVKITVVPAGNRPGAGGPQAEGSFVLPRGGNYLDYAFLETVIDGDCDLYLAAASPRPLGLFSLFGAFLTPLDDHSKAR